MVMVTISDINPIKCEDCNQKGQACNCEKKRSKAHGLSSVYEKEKKKKKLLLWKSKLHLNRLESVYMFGHLPVRISGMKSRKKLLNVWKVAS